jgi:hypothetical protein
LVHDHGGVSSPRKGKGGECNDALPRVQKRGRFDRVDGQAISRFVQIRAIRGQRLLSRIRFADM